MKKILKKVSTLLIALSVVLTSVPVSAEKLLDEAPVLEKGDYVYTAGSVAHNQQEALAWAKAQIGKSIDTDGYPAEQKYQCVDLVKAYYQYLGVSTPSGNAEAYRYKNVPNGWSRVYGNYQPGDIAVWKPNYTYGYYSSGAYGHVAIVTSADSNWVYVVNQNFSQTPYCTQNRFPIQVIDCAIRPDFNNSATVTCSWSEWVDSVTETNACIYGKINVSQRVQFTGAGVNIWDGNGNLIHQKTEGTKVNYNYMQISYNLRSELGVTLSPGQNYTYQMFADFGGKRYYGNKKTFRTSGSTATDTGTVDVSWSEWVDGVSQNNAVIYGKINTSKRVQFTGAGVSIWDASGNLIHQSSEGTSINYNYMQINYNLQSELGVTLSPGQSYTYQMFADFGGKHYYGNKKTFTTLAGVTSTNDKKVIKPNPVLKSTKKGQIQLSWKKYNMSDKYQIQYCRNILFIGAGKRNTATNDYTLVNLKSRKRYYIRVRSYRKIGNKNVYSAWSKVKSIKVK